MKNDLTSEYKDLKKALPPLKKSATFFKHKLSLHSCYNLALYRYERAMGIMLTGVYDNRPVTPGQLKFAVQYALFTPMEHAAHGYLTHEDEQNNTPRVG